MKFIFNNFGRSEDYRGTGNNACSDDLQIDNFDRQIVDNNNLYTDISKATMNKSIIESGVCSAGKTVRKIIFN